MPLAMQKGLAKDPAPCKAPAPAPDPVLPPPTAPPAAGVKWTRPPLHLVAKAGAKAKAKVPATTAPCGRTAEEPRENDQAQNRPAGSHRERHANLNRFFWRCSRCKYQNFSDRRKCHQCFLPADGHCLYDPENPPVPSLERSRSRHRHRTGRHRRSSSRGRSRGRGTAQVTDTPGASSSGTAATATGPPPVFNLVFPMGNATEANGLLLTPTEAAALVQRMMRGGRSDKRRRQTDPLGISSDGGQAVELTTAVMGSPTTVEADGAGAIADPDTTGTTAMTHMMTACTTVSTGPPAVTDAWPSLPSGTAPAEGPPAVSPVPELCQMAQGGPAPPTLPLPPNDLRPDLREWVGAAPPALAELANALLAS